jgi:hypothetical protein
MGQGGIEHDADEWGPEECESERDDEFLCNVRRIESGPLVSQFEVLTECGVDLPSPESLTDDELHAKLWEIVRTLAERDTFLWSTDHLSDRELYHELWSEVLRERTPFVPPGTGWRHHFDLIGGGSEKDVEIWLRYYASEKDREFWKEDFPEHHMPAREKPPYDRDRHLPRAEE